MPPKRTKRAKPVSESDDDDDSSFSDAPPPPKRTKRGKGATGKAAVAKSKKEPAVKVIPKYGLHKLPEMPLDIVFEILSYLDPVDLVHLMKVSQTFNTFLASDGAEPFWAAARRTWTFDEDELPPKPEDMAYYEFIDFLFGRYCHRCMKGTTLQTCFEVRARYCPPCRQILKRDNPSHAGYHYLGVELKSWVGKIPLNKSIADTNIYSLMPVLSDKRYLQENLVLRAHYPVRREDLTQFLDQLRNVKPKDQPKFLKERQKYVMRRRRDEPMAFHDFYSRQIQNRADTVKGKKEQRFKFIMDKLEEIDWAEEIELMDSHTLDNFKALPCVNQTKPMTDRMFKNAQAAIVEFLENTKAARLIQERKQTFKERLSLFWTMLPTLQAWRPGLPTPYEYATDLAECRAIMEQPNNVTVTRASFRALKDNGTLEAFTESQNAKSRAFFANDVRKLLGDVIPDSTDPLSLAVGALFQCNMNYCTTKGGWEHMRTHWCDQRGGIRYWKANDIYGETVAKIYGTRGWNEIKWYNFARGIKHVVELAGLDPATATPDDMDKSPVRFACSSCDDGHNHVETFGWTRVIHHESHLAKVYALTPAAAECARGLEPNALAEVAKSFESWEEQNYYCAICRNYYSRRDRTTRKQVLDHLRYHMHHIAEPQEGEHYRRVPLQDEWAFKRNWSVYLLPVARASKEKSWIAARHGALYFDFEEDKPAPEGFKPGKK